MRTLVSQEEESENKETLWNGNISMSFDTSYNDVPLQSNKPEENEEKLQKSPLCQHHHQ